jgi:hypothetical protein
MIVLFHVTIAISSLIATTATAIFPSRLKLIISKVLITFTLLSGTALVVLTHQPILSICVSGLVYLAAATSGMLIGSRRLARVQSSK